MIISPEHLLLPEWKQIHINRLLKLPPLQREQQLRHIATINILLVAKCLTSIRRPSIEFKEEIKSLAVSQFQELQNKKQSKKKAQQVLLALYELKGYSELTEIFKNISQPESIGRSLLVNILKNAATEFTFKLLDILFENYRSTLNDHTHQLWLWAVEALSDDLHLTKPQKEKILHIYTFFLQKEEYSRSIDLMYRRFPSCNGHFVKIFNIYNQHYLEFNIRQLKIHPDLFLECIHYIYKKKINLSVSLALKLIKAAPNIGNILKLIEIAWNKKVKDGYSNLHVEYLYNALLSKINDFGMCNDILNEMLIFGLAPSQITYFILLEKAKTFELAFGIFEEMKSKGLTPNEISYSTLINKAKTFEQAFGIFEEMKSKGLIPNVITFNTLLKKATETGKPLRIILDILEEMIAYQIAPNVESSKPYTLFAISAKLKKSRQPFKAWAMHQETKLAQLPPHIRNAWQMLFDAFN